MSSAAPRTAIVTGTLAAWLMSCNYTEGECYLRGEGGAGAGSGGGVVLPTGAGGFGEEPEPEGGDDGLACNAQDEGESDPEKPTEAGLKVFCLTADHGDPCAQKCHAKGIACGAIAGHPYKTGAGLGKLFSCNDLLIGFMCGYHYPNGDDCYFPYGTPFPKVCSYSGN